MIRWPRFLPDLTLWHEWHGAHGTLPAAWAGLDLPGVCVRLGVPSWAPQRPWRQRLPGIGVRDERNPTERVLTWATPAGTLTSRWTLGPDGDWWRSEYPVKSRDDLEAARLVAEARRYTLREEALPPDPAAMRVLELPQRPWSELFHSFLGWSEGLMLAMEEEGAVGAIVRILEDKLDGLERDLASMACDAVLLPDNLDGQFISPAAFEENLAASYGRVVSTFRAGGAAIVVHVGGPASRLLPGLAACGVHCVEGVCGAPQGDTPLGQARAAAGPHLVLWGGIAQDLLLATSSTDDFRSAAEAAFALARGDPAVVVGVADRVPVQAAPERLMELARMGR